MESPIGAPKSPAHHPKLKSDKRIYLKERSTYIIYRLPSISLRTSFTLPSCNKSTILLPTITPSQCALRFLACSGLETPKPARTGTWLCFFNISKYEPTSLPCEVRAQVVPVTETASRKPSDRLAISAKRSDRKRVG